MSGSEKSSYRMMFILLVLGAVVLLNPFRVFRLEPEIRRPIIPASILDAPAGHLVENHTEPERYLLSLISKYRVVLLGEYGRIREQVEFVTNLVPQLPAHGVSALGLSHVLAEDQEALERLIHAPEFDSERAGELLFNRKTIWGYREYLDLLEAIHKVNAAADSTDATPVLQVVGLGARRRYDQIRTREDLGDPSAVAGVFQYGIPDEIIAESILRWVPDNQGSILVFTSIEHSFTRFHQYSYSREMERYGFPGALRAGEILDRELGRQVGTVLLHSPWPDGSRRENIWYPAGGAIDAIIERVPENRRRTGFDLAGTPLGELPVPRGEYLEGYDSLRLRDLADGYIVLGPMNRYTGVTPIPDFINADNLDRAISEFPGPTPSRASSTGLNRYIRVLASDLEQVLRRFQ